MKDSLGDGASTPTHVEIVLVREDVPVEDVQRGGGGEFLRSSEHQRAEHGGEERVVEGATGAAGGIRTGVVEEDVAGASRVVTKVGVVVGVVAKEVERERRGGEAILGGEVAEVGGGVQEGAEGRGEAGSTGVGVPRVP